MSDRIFFAAVPAAVDRAETPGNGLSERFDMNFPGTLRPKCTGKLDPFNSAKPPGLRVAEKRDGRLIKR